jgi:putative ABC transport system permease protein
MIRNYIIISFRNLRKQLSYSLINILGLGIGLATCLLLVTWIGHELSYDKFHQKSERTYRVSLEYSFGGQVSRSSVSPTALLPALLSLPESETGVRVYNPSSTNPYIVKVDDKVFTETRFYAADSTFFKVFSYKLIRGNQNLALAAPYTVLLTQTSASKYFGDENPVGKVLQINGSQDYTVTGVLEDPPSNSLMQFDFVCSFQSLKAAQTEPTWWSANYQTFVVLHENANASAAKEKINDIVKKTRANEITSESDYVIYNFTPLTDIYLRSDFTAEPEPVSDIRYIYIFSAVALLILIIACINYVNLATARAADRAKEVGIRKVIGALRNQLFGQFIGESIIITFSSFCVAYLFAQALLPFFNSLTGKNLGRNLLLQPSLLGISIVILTLIGILAGAYPAFVITSFKPVSVLQGNFRTSGKGIWLRKSLVVFQFGISIALIAGTLIIVQQLNFIQEKNLGFERENTIVMPLDNQTKQLFETFKTEVMRTGAAQFVGRSSESPVNIKGGYTINTSRTNSPGVITTGLLADEEFIPAMGMQLLQGRNFTKEDRERVANDTVYAFILNEAALSALYIEPDEALGKHVHIGDRKGEIIGVVKNFHFASLHREIAPLTIFPEERNFNKMFIKLPLGEVSSRLQKIKEAYSATISHRPFEFHFLDQQYDALYKNEQRLSSVFIVFATLAVVIACLGLLGLVSFSASQRTKEIGIRKVLGATATNIIVLVAGDFTRLVFISILVGLPASYWLMTQWLSGFAYKTEIGVLPLIVSTLICVVIALGTAGLQAMKAAMIDPAETLRNQ